MNETATSLHVSEPAFPLSFDLVNYSGSATVQTSPSGNWSSLFLPSGWHASIRSFQVISDSVPDRGQLAGDYEITGFANCEPQYNTNPRSRANFQRTATRHARQRVCVSAPMWHVAFVTLDGVVPPVTNALLTTSAGTAKVGGG